MAIHFIKGVQSTGTGTSLKHFAANNQEAHRMVVDTLVDRRTLFEIYLPLLSGCHPSPTLDESCAPITG